MTFCTKSISFSLIIWYVDTPGTDVPFSDRVVLLFWKLPILFDFCTRETGVWFALILYDDELDGNVYWKSKQIIIHQKNFFHIWISHTRLISELPPWLVAFDALKRPSVKSLLKKLPFDCMVANSFVVFVLKVLVWLLEPRICV